MCMSPEEKADWECCGRGVVHRCRKSRTRREEREEAREKERKVTGAGDGDVGVRFEGSESS